MKTGLAGALALALTLVAGSAPPAAAQEAVVLSTGASRGFAHAGALVGLDALGHDPDLVVGASMGAVLGALYAAGYDADEIWRMVLRTDWADLFKPMPLPAGPGGSLRPSTLQVGVELGSLEFDRGFVDDWGVNRLLVHLLFDAGGRVKGDFDRLPRRYRAVAADVTTGQEVVMTGGDLARVARISMGVPGFFAPMEWEGRLLVDGGVANYLPISVARSLAVDTILAVDVTRPPEELGGTDPAAMGGRAIGLLMRNALRDTLPDVLLRPAIDPGFTGAVFPEDPGNLLLLGLEAALEAAPILPLDAAPERWLPAPPDRFGALVIESPDPAVAAVASRIFSDVAPGPWSPEAVLAAVDRLYATGLVSGVWPRVGRGPDLVADENGRAPDAPDRPSADPLLVVRVDPRPRTALIGDLGYDNDRGGRAWGGIRRRTSALGRPMEVSLTASVNGIERWVQAGLRLHPLAGGRVWGGGVHHVQTDVPAGTVEDEGGDPEVLRTGGWMAAQLRRIDPDWMTVLGVRAEHVDAGTGRAGLSWGPFARTEQASPPALGVGIPAEAELQWRLGPIDYWSAAARGARSFRLGPFPAAAVLEAAAAGGGAPPDVLPALGDRHAMPGYRWDEAMGEGTLVGGLDFSHAAPAGGLFRLRLRGGGVVGDLGAMSPDAWVAGAALEGLWPVPFGPVLVGVGANTDGRWRTEISLGPGF